MQATAVRRKHHPPFVSKSLGILSYVIMLVPCGSKDTAPISWEADKITWDSMRKETISICLPNEYLIPLE